MNARGCVVSDQSFPQISFEPITRSELNACLIAWKHRMGALRRPIAGWNHGLRCDGRLLAVVATDSLIAPRVAGLTRRDAVELSRLCAARADLCRVALRLWRVFLFEELAALRGYGWAVSYQDAVMHSGNLYRFDGWTRFGVSRSGKDARSGRQGRSKAIWGWCGVERQRPAQDTQYLSGSLLDRVPCLRAGTAAADGDERGRGG